MRRLGVVMLAVLAAFVSVSVLPATAAGAAESDGSDVSVTRYGGADRYETSLQVAEAVAADADGSLEWVVLVSGRRWTDAVVAAPVAGALGAPVLMTPPEELRADALAFLQRVGVSKALVVGPDASGGAHGPGRGVGTEVLEALEAADITAARVAGDDLYGTGVAAAGRVTPGTMGNLGRTAVIASGEVFADALVAGPFAARGIHPMLLTPPGELHADVAGYLGDAGISHVVLMGGTAALSDAVEQAVEDLGIDVSRMAGSTRYDTAVKAAELAEDKYSTAAGKPCFANDTIGVARARVPFDSFSAAPLLGRLCAPLVLADPGKIPGDTAAYLDAARGEHDAVDLRVFGGDAAVSQTAIDAYLTGEEPETGDDGEATDEADDGEATAAPGVLPAGTCGGSIDDEPSQLVPSTNAEDPAWSPDCSRLVYTEDGALWLVDNDGANRQRLVPAAGGYRHAAVWSPLGDRIAYVSGFHNADDRWVAHIWTVNVDGSHNNQRTEGEVIDSWPTWSPDGKRIAFERHTGSDSHIVVMTSFGNKPKALNTGGAWERSPAWSPDGTSLAYQADGYLVVSDVDGDNARRVHAAVYFDGGLSWSPDGERIAFVRGDGNRTAIVVADVDGPDEEVIYDEGLRTLAPRWSPDGQRIAFHTIDTDGKHRAYVTGASGQPAMLAADCRPRGVSGVTAGFPLPRWAVSATGTLRVAVLFMDFSDAEAAHTTAEEAEQGLPYVEHYLESVSYGQLDVELVPHHAWLRSEREFGSFIQTNQLSNQAVTSAAIGHAMELAAPSFDFADIDTVMVVLASSHFAGGGFAHASFSSASGTWPSTLINSVHRGAEGAPQEWGSVASHELVHNLGLADLYSYGRVFADREAPDGKWWIASEWGRMNMWAYFLVDENDPRLAHDWTYPDGAVSTAYRHHLRIEEMLAWSRWQLGWLSDAQVSCLSDTDPGETVSVTLAPVAEPDDGMVMAAVPLNAREMIVIESRRKLGYDAGGHYEAADSGAVTTFPRLITEGVLVYTVDSLRSSGQLPLRVAGDNGDLEVDDFPVLEPGESVTLRGYTITVTADDGDTHAVSITRDK
ncbi:cell wall-binding repeat-containing protein [Candidatus Poriferisodalis sp.]|uniref:cell wall-binding repeat-containing protein n=1 Tax=Candidatus Poriferisodalis sp. TaxID=3101277 RepID=UPI003B027A03